ncbi:MAG: hypothetical protein IPP71_02750 [Bacteroidetes bacterium]|nr:hypothetical protein [Bacteroidota bacterium]
MKKGLAFIFLIALCLPGYVNSQGCSDAGFCSLGNLKLNATSDSVMSNNVISGGMIYGMGLDKTQTFTSFIDYQHYFYHNFNVQSKVTTVYASGKLGNNFGLGDWYVSGNFSFHQKNKSKLSASVGIKVPLNASNNKNDEGLPLPLDYQSSLATYDVILGSHLDINQFGISAGLQLPVIQNNENTFFPWLYENMEADQFTATNKFVRKGDILLRSTYRISIPNSSIVITPAILAIYHLGNDSFQNVFNQKTEINNSEGLTINAMIQATKRFRNFNEMELVIASPLIVREIRPDGLTRSLVLSIQYKIPF